MLFPHRHFTLQFVGEVQEHHDFVLLLRRFGRSLRRHHRRAEARQSRDSPKFGGDPCAVLLPGLLNRPLQLVEEVLQPCVPELIRLIRNPTAVSVMR